MEQTTLSAQLRTEQGKGPARRLRAKGLVPAVIYGRGQKAIPLAVAPDKLKAAVATRFRLNTLIKLEVVGEGDGAGTRLAMLKDYETDPVTRGLLHADFIEVQPDKELTVEVPLVLTGKPVGVTEGGILQQTRRFLDVVCMPKDIPEKIEVDVSSIKIGHSMHVSDVKVPGLKLKYATNYTIAAVVAPEKEEVAAPAAAPGAEGAAPAAGAPAGAAASAGGAPAGSAAPAAGAPAKAAAAPEKKGK